MGQILGFFKTTSSSSGSEEQNERVDTAGLRRKLCSYENTLLQLQINLNNYIRQTPYELTLLRLNHIVQNIANHMSAGIMKMTCFSTDLIAEWETNKSLEVYLISSELPIADFTVEPIDEEYTFIKLELTIKKIKTDWLVWILECFKEEISGSVASLNKFEKRLPAEVTIEGMDEIVSSLSSNLTKYSHALGLFRLFLLEDWKNMKNSDIH